MRNYQYLVKELHNVINDMNKWMKKNKRTKAHFLTPQKNQSSNIYNLEDPLVLILDSTNSYVFFTFIFQHIFVENNCSCRESFLSHRC